MRVLAMSLITHTTDPLTGEVVSARERFNELVEQAQWVEQLGFDGFAVGERHERPFISSSPTVVLSHVAALTSRIRLFTAVTTLSLLDPVRAYEDYATLDNLSGGRLELIIGKGNGTAQRDLFAVSTDDQWARNAEGYEVFRQLWRHTGVSADTRFRPPLDRADVWPEPYQQPIRVWHGSATSQASVELAVQYGDPLFSANVTHAIEPYAALVRHYRETWERSGNPGPAVVGAGTAGVHVAPTSQQARDEFEPIWQARQRVVRNEGAPAFADFDDFVARSSALIGSPQQVLDKVGRQHEQLGHVVTHLSLDRAGLTATQQRDGWELLADQVLPVLHRDYADPPWEWAPAGLGGKRTPADPPLAAIA